MKQSFKKTWWKFLLVPVAATAIILLPQYIKDWMNNPEKKLVKDYLSHLFILQHDFVYKVTFPVNGKNTSLYLIKNSEEQFDAWDPGETTNRVTAATFMKDSSGTCITSRYAAEPWMNETDINFLKKLISKEGGINPDDILVSGMTVKLIITQAEQLAIGNKTEIECMPYESFANDDNICYIGRKNTSQPLPVKNIEFGQLYTNNLEAGKKVYALCFPNIDLNAGIPFENIVTGLTLSASNNDYSSDIIFNSSASWIPEGAPVFDKDLNMVGVYSQVNFHKKANCISVLTRHGQSDIPENLKMTINNSVQQQINSIPNIPDFKTIDSIDDAVNKSIRQATNSSPFFTFTKTPGWQVVYETSNLVYSLQKPGEYSSEKNETSADVFCSGGKYRIRLKTELAGASLKLVLLKKNEYGNYEEEKRIETTENGSNVYDLGFLNGTYSVGIIYNSSSVIFRAVWEKEKN